LPRVRWPLGVSSDNRRFVEVVVLVMSFSWVLGPRDDVPTELQNGRPWAAV
jgi:hypothetical protein